MVMQFKQCCCGCTLGTGSVIIGILYAIGSLSTLIACIVNADAFNEARKESDGAGDSSNVTEDLNTGAEVFFIIYAVMSAVQLLFSVMLILGASAEKPDLLKPWIVAEIVNAVVTGITNVIQIIVVFATGAVALGFILLIVYAILMCIFVYFILVVNSFYNELTTRQFSMKI